MRILGIDPGTLSTGYGFIEKDGTRPHHLDNGEIVPPKNLSISQRLKWIHDHLIDLIGCHQPEVLAVEDIFYSKNVQSSIRLGYARGVVLLAGAQRGLEVREYSPMEVKLAVVGYGRATKEQVQEMVKRLLKIQISSNLNASDALATAICHAHTDSARFNDSRPMLHSMGGFVNR
ncbi:MAG: crossover junction endodeoxyribonuclease RuvC [Deltaproteobacteria bacterium]|nr:crossover junction endodeoxyribonuclease RuvC [Deltaproteobacteria bacterium]